MPIRRARSCPTAKMRNRRVLNSAKKPVTKSMKLYVFLSFIYTFILFFPAWSTFHARCELD